MVRGARERTCEYISELHIKRDILKTGTLVGCDGVAFVRHAGVMMVTHKAFMCEHGRNNRW